MTPRAGALLCREADAFLVGEDIVQLGSGDTTGSQALWRCVCAGRLVGAFPRLLTSSSSPSVLCPLYVEFALCLTDLWELIIYDGN